MTNIVKISDQEKELIDLLSLGHTKTSARNIMELEKEEFNEIYERPHVKMEVKVRRQEAMQRFKEDKNSLINVLKSVILNDVTDLFDENGDMKPFDKIPESYRACINQIEFKKTENRFGIPMVSTKVVMMDKMKALEMLARHLGMFDGKKDTGESEFKIGFE